MKTAIAYAFLDGSAAVRRYFLPDGSSAVLKGPTLISASASDKDGCRMTSSPLRQLTGVAIGYFAASCKASMKRRISTCNSTKVT